MTVAVNDPSPLVSVVIPCRNEAKHIEQCLRSILEQQLPAGGFEIIVADGWSDDGTREILHRIASVSPRLKVVDNAGRIVSTGLNAAIRVARGEIVVRMDAHTEYAPDYIRRCVEVLKETGADNVGGAAQTIAHTHMERAIAAAYHSPFAVGGARFHQVDYEGYVDTVTYGCWRRELFDRVGFFDEELVRNQDDEHNLRIVRAGGKIWQSTRVKSWYRPRGSLRTLFRQYMQYGYWKVRVIKKHRLPASIRHLVPGAFVFTLAALCLISILGLLVSAVRSLPPLLCRLPWLAFTMLLAAYLAAVLAASVVTARKRGWSLLPVLPAVFACYHFGYGYGFLRGAWDFVIRGKRPTSQFVELSRPDSKPGRTGLTEQGKNIQGCWRQAAVRRWLDWPWQVRWCLFLTYAGLVTWVSLAPAETFKAIPCLFSHQDKAVHFLIYGVLVSLARWAMAAHWTVRPAFLVVVVGAIAYGSLMEILQGAMTSYGRCFELGDIVANSLGALCFWWVSQWMFVPSAASNLLADASPDRPT